MKKNKLKLKRDYYIALCIEYTCQNIFDMTLKQRTKSLKRMLKAVISLDLDREINNIDLDRYIDKLILDVYQLDW